MYMKSRLALILTVFLSGCSWVSVSEEGRQVELSRYEQTVDCKKLGFTRSLVKHKIGFVERDREKMTQELVALAKNEAAIMGGDTIVARGPVKQGVMVFDIYRCH